MPYFFIGLTPKKVNEYPFVDKSLMRSISFPMDLRRRIFLAWSTWASESSIEAYTYSQIYQHFTWALFVPKCFAQLFSSYVLALAKVWKHFCTKTRALNVDEIVTYGQIYQHFTSSFCTNILLTKNYKAKLQPHKSYVKYVCTKICSSNVVESYTYSQIHHHFMSSFCANN